MKTDPPKRALQFLRWFCRDDYLEEIEGNLIELYEKQQEASSRKADWYFVKNVLLHFRPDYLRSFRPTQERNHYDMFKHYFKVASRSLWKQKLYAFINILGLAIGLSCFILIFLYVQHELSYDHFFENKDHIYRVYQRQKGNIHMGTDYFGVTPAPLAQTLIKNYPEVDKATAVVEKEALLGNKREAFLEDGLLADSLFFEVFPFSFLFGNAQNAFLNPQDIVLTESLAQKVFNNKNPVGQSILYQDKTLFTITGVIKDPPSTSSLQFSFVMNVQSDESYLREMKRDKWYNNFCHTFFTLIKDSKPTLLEAKLPDLLVQNAPTPGQETYYVEPLSDIHFSKMNADIGLKGNTQYVRLFSLIGLLVLLLACINYINLAITRSIKRAKEVGMRKVIGATRWQLIWQFIGESIFIAFLAFLLSLAIVQYLSPFFSYLLERPIALNIFENIYLLPVLLLLIIIVGVLSGIYPAFLVSGLQPVKIFNKRTRENFSGIGLQQFLMVGQYTVSVALIISSIVIYRQFIFIQSKELGFNKEQVLTIRLQDPNIRNQYEIIKKECLSNPAILGMTASSHLPTNITSSTTINDDEDSQGNDLSIYESWVSYDYLNVFEMDLLAGRFFSPDHPLDIEEGYVLNESAVSALGWLAEEAVGKQFTHNGTETIIGVVKDFHMHSMHLPIQPLMLHLGDNLSHFSLKIRPENLSETITFLEKVIKQYSPYPLEYSFLDQQFDQLYKTDLRVGELFGFFTILSILIASLGLFGMAAFSTTQRIKEIGIRKVLGASLQQIVGILSIDFMKMVLLGIVLAIPVAWYAMDIWLQDFAYRISLEWWMFILAGLATFVIAWLIISSQTLKVALSNPVEALKNG